MHSLTAPSSSSSASLLLFPNQHHHRHTLFHLTPPFIFSFRYTTVKRLHVHLHVQEGKALRKRKGRKGHKGLCCKDWDENTGGEEGGFSPLEADILEFMRSSKNPSAFPTREELVAAGRVDLADAIVSRGGWLAFGWDLDRGSRESHDFDGGAGGGWSGEIDGSSPLPPPPSSDVDNSCRPAKSA